MIYRCRVHFSRTKEPLHAPADCPVDQTLYLTNHSFHLFLLPGARPAGPLLKVPSGSPPPIHTSRTRIQLQEGPFPPPTCSGAWPVPLHSQWKPTRWETTDKRSNRCVHFGLTAQARPFGKVSLRTKADHVESCAVDRSRNWTKDGAHLYRRPLFLVVATIRFAGCPVRKALTSVYCRCSGTIFFTSLWL
jgi:hypothetical protein